MWSRERELLAQLTDDERASLGKLCRCGCDQRIPGEHAEHLLSLGLAELTCGGLGPTSAGRHAIAYAEARIAAE